MAEIKEEVIDEILDDEDRKKLALLDKKDTESSNLNEREKEKKKMAKEKEKNSASAIRMAIAALVLALCTLGYCYYSIAVHNEKLDALLEKNNNMEYTLNDVKETESTINRFSDMAVSTKADAGTNTLLAKSINVKVAPEFNYKSQTYNYCNIPVRVTNVSSEKATYTISFALTNADKSVKEESIVVDALDDGATRDYAIFSANGKNCKNISSSNVVITKVVK